MCLPFGCWGFHDLHLAPPPKKKEEKEKVEHIMVDDDAEFYPDTVSSRFLFLISLRPLPLPISSLLHFPFQDSILPFDIPSCYHHCVTTITMPYYNYNSAWPNRVTSDEKEPNTYPSCNEEAHWYIPAPQGYPNGNAPVYYQYPAGAHHPQYYVAHPSYV